MTEIQSSASEAGAGRIGSTEVMKELAVGFDQSASEGGPSVRRESTSVSLVHGAPKLSPYVRPFTRASRAWNERTCTTSSWR